VVPCNVDDPQFAVSNFVQVTSILIYEPCFSILSSSQSHYVLSAVLKISSGKQGTNQSKFDSICLSERSPMIQKVRVSCLLFLAVCLHFADGYKIFSRFMKHVTRNQQ
jgi:hypothetical protein